MRRSNFDSGFLALAAGRVGTAGAEGFGARFALAGVALVSAVALVLTGVAALPAARTDLWVEHRDAAVEPIRSFGNLPLSFEANAGQTDRRVDYLARGPGFTLFLTGDEAVLSLGGGEALRMQLVGADGGAAATGRDRLEGVVNYLTGSNSGDWRTDVPTYRTVAYDDVYPGIDVVYYGNQGLLEYDFVVAPGANADDIVLRFDGARSLSLDGGELVVGTPAGEVRQSAPVVYQDTPAGRREVEGRFVRRGPQEVGFAIGDHDRTLPLVIDPTLGYGTYVGSPAFDITFGVAVDGEGRAYVTGHTSGVNFPTKGTKPCVLPSPTPTPSYPTTSFQGNSDTNQDAFVTVLSPDGSSVEWSTYLGGGNFDQAWDIAVDGKGRAYLAGATASWDKPETPDLDESFPTTEGAFDRQCGSDGACDNLFGDDPLSDTFVAKLSADGEELLYSSYLGGSDFDQEVQTTALPSEMDIAVHNGKAYMVGATASADFPTTSGAPDRTCGLREVPIPVCDDGNRDAFLAIFDTRASGTDSLALSTFLGGSGTEEGRGVGVDNAGNVYVAGTTYGFEENPNDDDSPTVNNLKTKSALYDDYRGGEADAFVMKINPRKQGSAAFVYTTYLGGGARDQAWGLAVKSPTAKGKRGRGSVFVVGFTDSGDDPVTPQKDGYKPYFPRTKGAFDRTYEGQHTTENFDSQFLNGDAFLSKLKPSGEKLAYSGLIGGEFHDVAADVAVDRKGRAYVTGYVTCDTRRPEDPPCNATRFPVVNALEGWAEMFGIFPNPSSPSITNIPTDAFAVKVTADGKAFVYSMFINGGHFDRGFGVAVRDRNAQGDPISPEAYYVGRTNSADVAGTTEIDERLPAVIDTDNAFQQHHNGGGRDGYVIKIRG